MLMTPEEKERYDRIDRQLEFLASHQARLSSDLAELKGIVAMHSLQIEKQGEQITMHSQQIEKQSHQIAEVGNYIQSLGTNVLRLGKIIDERDRQTDARINALIGVVERYFSNGKK